MVFHNKKHKKKSVFQDVFKGIGKAVKTVGDLGKTVVGSVWKEATGVIHTGTDYVKNVGEGIKSVLVGTGSGIEKGLPAVGQGIGQFAGGIGKLISSPFLFPAVIIGGLLVGYVIFKYG